ncbi:GtrA family protein [Nigerium massiliense]|uniref:GtrA family protein n=1 Tax=Nigerium massiliense TaxID=1522317 RepID=UPI00058D5BF9|nr:GtrA family protein [Nigerium massiliense]
MSLWERLYKRWGYSAVQFLKFGLVGGSGVLVNMFVAFLMNKANGGTVNAQRVVWGPIPGTAFNIRYTLLVWIGGFLVANVWNFLLNRHWTFAKDDTMAPFWKELWPFFTVGSIAAAVGAVIKIALTNPTSPIYLPDPWFHESTGLQSREYWSQLLAIVFTLPINYVINKLWTFRSVRRRHAQATAQG